MNRFSVRAACLLLPATAWLAVPASAADLPQNTPLIIMMNGGPGDGFDLEGNIGPTTTGVQLRDFSTDFANTPTWVFLATGQQGRLAIVKQDAAFKLWFLEAEPGAMPTDPDGVKVSPFTAIAAVPPTGQWRIIEPLVSGPFNIMNVQSGRLLEADLTDLTGTKVQLHPLGRDSSKPNRQWRFIPSRPTWTTPDPIKPAADSPAGTRTLLLKDLGLTGGNMSVEPTGAGVNLAGKDLEVSVEVTIIGSGSNELKARVKMTVKDLAFGGKTVDDTQVYPILTVAPGRKVFLHPEAGDPMQSFTYSAGPNQLDMDDKWRIVSIFPKSADAKQVPAPPPALHQQ